MLKIKNWSSMQSYKDRRPPWIRLHKTLLDDFEFHSMSVNARALLPMLWLLASEDEDPVSGLLRDGYEKIAFRLRMQKKDVESGILECVNSGFIERLNEHFEQVTGSSQIRNQTVTPETETETYRADREDTDIIGAKAPSKKLVRNPDDVSESVWQDHLKTRRAKKQPITQTALDGMRREAAKLGWTLEQALTESCSRGWASFKAEWINQENGKQNGKTRSQLADEAAERALRRLEEQEDATLLIGATEL